MQNMYRRKMKKIRSLFILEKLNSIVKTVTYSPGLKINTTFLKDRGSVILDLQWRL